jgi:uncharacterized protein (DUF58 family)
LAVNARFLSYVSVKKSNYEENVYLETSFSEKIGQWLSAKARRQSQVVLSQKNIYIFPTGQGFAFLFLLLLMLLTAVNYQNSLIYLMTFFLSAILFISIWVCFFNFAGLEVASGDKACCFADENAFFGIQFYKKSKPVFGMKVGIARDETEFCQMRADEKVDYALGVGVKDRGLHVLDRLRVESLFPFGLIRSWTWVKLDSQLLIYPKPVKSQSEQLGLSAESNHQGKLSGDDVGNLRLYQHGDSSSRINWKKFASTEQLVVHDVEQVGFDPIWLRWDNYKAANEELRLQNICFDICKLYDEGKPFGLSLPGKTIMPSGSPSHKMACLEALALF